MIKRGFTKKNTFAASSDKRTYMKAAKNIFASLFSPNYLADIDKK